MKAQTNESFEAAKKAGLSFFWAHMHLGHTISCAAQSWEEAGFTVNREGNPVKDFRGNTVASFTTEELEAGNSDHLSLCEEWYG